MREVWEPAAWGLGGWGYVSSEQGPCSQSLYRSRLLKRELPWVNTRLVLCKASTVSTVHTNTLALALRKLLFLVVTCKILGRMNSGRSRMRKKVRQVEAHVIHYLPVKIISILPRVTHHLWNFKYLITQGWISDKSWPYNGFLLGVFILSHRRIESETFGAVKMEKICLKS